MSSGHQNPVDWTLQIKKTSRLVLGFATNPNCLWLLPVILFNKYQQKPQKFIIIVGKSYCYIDDTRHRQTITIV